MDDYTFFFVLIGICTVAYAFMKALARLEGEK